MSPPVRKSPRKASTTRAKPHAPAPAPTQVRADPARYAGWLDGWCRTDTPNLETARQLIARCHGDLGWLTVSAAEPLATALLEAYDAYPELSGDYPTWGFASRIAAAPTRGPEQDLSNLMIARRLDPSPDWHLAVLIAGRTVVDPQIYAAELSRWMETRPSQSQVTRLLRALAEDEPRSDALDIVGRLAGYGTSLPSVSGSLIARFGHRLTASSDDSGPPPPSGAALVRARKALDAVTAGTEALEQERARGRLDSALGLRAILQRAGYDAARPPRPPKGRVIHNPSWIGGWPDFVLRDGLGRLNAHYFETQTATRDPRDGSMTADCGAPYRLAKSPPGELPIGRFRMTFRGQVTTETVVVCEVTGYTGLRAAHRMAVSAMSASPAPAPRRLAVPSLTAAPPTPPRGPVSDLLAAFRPAPPVNNPTVFGVLEFVLAERAADVVISLDIESSGGAVTFMHVDVERIDL